MSSFKKTEEWKQKIGEGLRKSWAKRLNRPMHEDKTFILDGKVIKTKLVCESCGKESRTRTLYKCGYCGKRLVKKIVVDKC